MSIASEIQRLQTAKADLKTAIEAKGVTVPSNATIDTYDDYVAQITGGLTQDVSGTPYCNSTNLVVDVQKQISIDGGTSWVNSGSPFTVIVESGASECDNFSLHYLTFVAETDNVTFALSDGVSSNVFQYSLDNGLTWSNLQVGQTSPSINRGESILWKASSLSVSTDTGIGIIRPSASARVEGNVMSLIYGDNFIDQISIPNNFQLRRLFSGATNIISAENMVIPATTLRKQCYSGMFQGCTNMTTPPKKIGDTAITWSGGDYVMSDMFNGCSSLTTAPELPALNLTTACYWYMFEGCTSLLESPILPATTLASQCYQGMFNGCSNLSTITCLAASPSNYTNYWVTGVQTTSGTFYKNPSATWSRGNSAVPNNWTIVDYSS